MVEPSASDLPVWCPRYSDEKTFRDPPTVTVLSHPLLARTVFGRKNQSIVVEETREQTKPETETQRKYEFVDPLGATNEEDVDPNVTRLERLEVEETERRRQIELDNTLETKGTDRLGVDIDLPNFEPWSKRRATILESFTTNEKMSISSSFLPSGGARMRVADKRAYRLEMLEDMSGLKKLAELSAHEYVHNVNELKEMLVLAWNNNKRVEAVRLVTELARTLSSTSTPSFYPSQWVLVTDVLDLFGTLVYERILAKANEERIEHGKSRLTVHFTSHDIMEKAKEMAKNWFCKIGDIKELIPRFYVETSLISCLRFLDSSALHVNLHRLASMPSRITHSLTAAYARAYVAKISMFLEPSDRAPHWRVLNDWMQTYTDQVQSDLLWPALEWIIQCVSYGAHTHADLAPLWEYCRQSDKRPLVLRSFLKAVPPKYIANHADEVVKIVCTEGVTADELYSFGESILKTETPDELRVGVLKGVWRATTRLSSVSDSTRCSIVWGEFAARYFSINELNVICESLLRKLNAEKKHDKLLPHLVAVVDKMVSNRKEDLSELIQLNAFVSLMDLIRDEPFRSDAAHSLLTAFVKVNKVGGVKDFRLANLIVDQSFRLMSPLSDPSQEEEKKQRARLVESALDRFDLSSDPERALSWMVQARAQLCEVERVVKHVMRLMLTLSMRIQANMKSGMGKANLLRAVIANLYITLPSLSSPSERFSLGLQTAHVSLQANSLPQTDALLRLCLESLLECTLSPPQWVARCSHFLSFLLHVPDSPNKPMMFMFNALLNVIDRRTWTGFEMEYGACLVHCLDFIWAAGREEYPTRFTNVQANDELYGGSEEFRLHLCSLSSHILSRLLPLIEREQRPSVGAMLLEHLVARVDLGGDQEMLSLATTILQKCLRFKDMRHRSRWIVQDLQKVNSNGAQQLLYNCGLVE